MMKHHSIESRRNGACLDQSVRAGAEPFSARGVLATALLACLPDFAHVARWPDLPNAAVSQGRMLRHQLDSMIHVPRLEEPDAAELFLGFRIGSVGGCHFAVFPGQRKGGFLTLKRFANAPVPVGAKMLVKVKAFVVHGVSFGLSHGIEFSFVVVTQTDVFHWSLLLPDGSRQQCVAPAHGRTALFYLLSP